MEVAPAGEGGWRWLPPGEVNGGGSRRVLADDEDGGWRMEYPGWRMDGGWKMVDGGPWMEDGGCRMEDGWRMEDG